MEESRRCPECGSKLPTDAPAGLCPGCLLMAAVSSVDRGMVGAAATEAYGGLQSGISADLDRFKQAILEMGLLRAGELDRALAGAIGGVPELARALVKAGKLTVYQAAALSQGKGRGLVIGNYFILDRLGAGGMGVVFKARHRRLGRVVAVKILPPSLARDAGLVGRFRREVDVASRLDHPNVVAVLDADEDRGVPFMTMEYIEGHDLDRLVRDRGPLSVDLALDCMIQAARGLEAAHDQGIVHRDIKPGNLMLDGRGTVRVLDLGLARLVEAANPFGQATSGPLTRSGTYMGTVDFMAPEQGIDSSRVDHRADVYSLGCTLCYLLTGRAPFAGANILARLMAHQESPPASLRSRRHDVSATIDSAYLAMMAKRPDDRPATMSEVIRILEACWTSAARAREARTVLESLASSCSTAAAVGSTELIAGPAPIDPKGKPITSTVLARTESARWIATPAGPSRARLRTTAALAAVVVVLLAIGGGALALLGRHRESPIPETQAKAAETAGLGGGDAPATKPTRGSTTFDVATIYQVFDWNGHQAGVDAIAVDKDGVGVLIAAWNEHCDYVRIADGTKMSHQLGKLDGNLGWQGGQPNIAISPDGSRALVGTSSVLKDNVDRVKAKPAGILWGWDLTGGKQLFPRRQPYSGAIRAVAISVDGLRGLTVGPAGELDLWDLATGTPRRLIDRSAAGVVSHALAFFPDGQKAAMAGRDGRVHLWDLDEGRERAAWEGHGRPIQSLAISSDGHRMATAGDDGTIILWDADRDSTELARLRMPPHNAGAEVAFDAEGNLVAAGHGFDKSPKKPGDLIVWDGRTFAELRRDETPFIQHTAVATLPNGQILTGDRHAIRLWTPRSAVEAQTPTPDRDSSPVDLLALVGPSTNRVLDWQPIGGGGLAITTNGGARLQLPVDPPLEYRIELTVERFGNLNGYGFALHFPVAGRLTEFVVDQAYKDDDSKPIQLSGLIGLDGAPASRTPGVHHGRLLEENRPTQFEVTVRRNSIRVTCDGARIVDWVGNPKRLIPFRRWNVQNPKRPFLAAATPMKFHRVVLTPLPPDR